MKLCVGALCAVLLLAGCSKDISNNEAVRKGVVDYLSKRTGQTGLDMNLMDVTVTDVRFDRNEATATVAFKPKGGGSEGMSMNYALERQGNQWVVKGRKETGMNPHGGQMPGQMAPGGMPGSGAAMPPNHPPIEKKAPSDNK